MVTPRSGFLAVLLATSLTAPAPGQDVLTLRTRTRTETESGSGRWHSLEQQAEWNPKETAIVVCDMWDRHWCPNATKRVGQLAPEMNKVIEAARQRGVLIIHCPSDTLDYYKDTPQRQRAAAAPVVETKIPLQSWCHLDNDVEGPALPIDDSDGGCDCEEPVESYRAWSRQHPAIRIAQQDAITDSAEAFYLMKQQGIRNVIVMGVHTNMCVLGRPFSIRQMVQQGQNVVLMRDMTDTMYNPAMSPFVSHFSGTDLVVQHIEQYWCPTITSSDFTGGPEFRFPEDTRKHLVILCAESEYQTAETLPAFARQHLGHDFRVSFVWHDEESPNSFPGLEVINSADLLVVSVRRRTPTPQQLNIVRKYCASGKPLIGIRTASHAFCLRNTPAPAGQDQWEEFDRDVIGGSYTNHHGSGPQTAVRVAAGASEHPLLQDVELSQLTGRGSLYKVSPLQTGATPVLIGTIPDAAPEPVAWLFHRKAGGTTFYTSLGHPDDFSQPAFRKLLQNAAAYLTAADNVSQ